MSKSRNAILDEIVEQREELSEIAELFKRLDKHKKELILSFTRGAVMAVELEQKGA